MQLELGEGSVKKERETSEVGRYGRVLKLGGNKGENISILSSKPRDPKHGQALQEKDFKKASRLDRVDLEYSK